MEDYTCGFFHLAKGSSMGRRAFTGGGSPSSGATPKKFSLGSGTGRDESHKGGGAAGKGTAGGSGPGGPAGSPASRHLGSDPVRKWLKLTAIALSAVLVAGFVFVGVQLLRLQSNIVTQPLNLGTDAAGLPVDPSKDPLQILILGTDTRTGEGNSQYGTEEDASGFGNSDVMMLMNLSADRQRVTVVSFPRDLLVPLPTCQDPETDEVYPEQELGQLNSALSLGGPGCTVAAINELTGLEIDHFMMADFNSVKELSETLGGVEVCLNQPVNDPKSGLDLPAGVSSIQGEQALAFLRTRAGFGNGGDQGRIRAQQSFLASMVRKVNEEGTLNNLPKLYSIAETVTRNLTVDKELTEVSSLIALAGRLKDVDLSRVAFVTAPVVPYEYDNNRLVLDEAAATPLFKALVEDKDITEPAPEPAPATPSEEGTETPAVPEESAPAIDPAAIPVTILDATGNSDDAGSDSRDRELAAQLLAAGYAQASAGGQTAAASPATQIFYAPGYQEMAEQVADYLGVPSVQVVASNLVIGVSVQVGEDFKTGDTLPDGGDVGGLSGQTAAQVTCQSAFGN
jgi:LCP family protein required for cell wall assembly